MPEAQRRRVDWLHRSRVAAGPVVIAAVGLWAIRQGWGLWGDVQVDFGRELYVPWRLAAGDRLYADIAYFNAPLSPYFNALCFRIFGVGVSTLVGVNIAIAGLIAALLYRLLVRVSDRFSATVAGVVFAAVFAFGHPGEFANYNYATPYSHEITHGLLLALVALSCLARALRLGSAAPSDAGEVRSPDPPRVRSGLLLLAGMLSGLVELTKVEVFTALFGAALAGIVLDHFFRRRKASESIRNVGSYLGGVAGLLALAFFALSIAISSEHAGEALWGPWRSAFDPRITSLMFYRWVRGTLDLQSSWGLIRSWSMWYAAWLVPLGAIALACRGRAARWLLPAAVVALLALLLGHPPSPTLAPQSIRPLPVVIPLLLVAVFVQLLRERRRGHDVSTSLLRMVLLCFGLGLQAKMILNAQIYHYGFALMMPSTLLLVVALVGWLPALVRQHSGSGLLFRMGACALVLWLGLGVVERSRLEFAKLVVPVGAGADALMADQRGRFVNPALEYLGEELPARATLAVLPEGVMLNYLLRTVNPTPYINFMPPELLLFGEDSMLAAFADRPPDFIVLVHNRTDLYGFRYFGEHYGRRLYAWVMSNYVPVKTIGRPPLKDGTGFGIAILRHRAAP